MRIRYTKHAQKRMRERGIARPLVRMAIEEPDRSYLDRELNVAERKLESGNILRVYFKREGEDTVVITVYHIRTWGRGRR